jgi:hypothetical protein
MTDIYLSTKRLAGKNLEIIDWLTSTIGEQFFEESPMGSFKTYLEEFNQSNCAWFYWSEWYGYTFHFRNKKDAVLFKLTWC